MDCIVPFWERWRGGKEFDREADFEESSNFKGDRLRLVAFFLVWFGLGAGG